MDEIRSVEATIKTVQETFDRLPIERKLPWLFELVGTRTAIARTEAAACKTWMDRANKAEAQLAEAQAVIDKLPKCWRLADGELVRDVPMVPKLVYYAWCRDQYDSDDSEEHLCELVWWKGGGDDCFNPEYTFANTEENKLQWEFFTVGDPYSTREAAQAAKVEK